MTVLCWRRHPRPAGHGPSSRGLDEPLLLGPAVILALDDRRAVLARALAREFSPAELVELAASLVKARSLSKLMVVLGLEPSTEPDATVLDAP